LWPQAIQAACHAHEALPALPAVGWDVALCQDGVLIVEGNPTFDVDLLQFTHARGMRPLFAYSYGLAG
jgi:Sugar-transfer associated ATP-grasp